VGVDLTPLTRFELETAECPVFARPSPAPVSRSARRMTHWQTTLLRTRVALPRLVGHDRRLKLGGLDDAATEA